MRKIVTLIRRSPRLKLAVVLAASSTFVGGSIFLSQQFWRENGLRALEAVNEQRVQLVVNAIKAEINRQDHLPIVLALDSDVRRALAHPDDRAQLDHLSRKLQRLSSEADTGGLFVIGPDGTVLASSDWNSPDSRIGRNYAALPFFASVMASGRSRYLGPGSTSGRAHYYIAEAIRDAGVLGVAVVRIGFDLLEAAWQRAGERILVTDANGVVFLASDPALKGRHVAPPQSPSTQPGGAPPVALTLLEQRGDNAIVQVKEIAENATYLYRSVPMREYGWSLHRFADLSAVRADQRDGAIIGGAMSALLISLVLYILQRHRAYRVVRDAAARLQSEVEARTRELREANASLQAKIDEHRQTEAQLRATQNELVQAGKLAALGQMSAAIAHEINQPLGAIRTFIASTKKFIEAGEIKRVIHNLDLIAELTERMASITGHLKTFARKSEPNRPEPFPVERAVAGALFLIEGQLKSARVKVQKDIQADAWVMGYPVQLEQVLVNLVRNALDAVAHVKNPQILVRVRASRDTVSISVSDNGTGIPPDLIERIFDPFMTTKPVGKGLGLGLSISYGIVQDLHGRIYAANRPEGGAELTIELPRFLQETAVLARATHA